MKFTTKIVNGSAWTSRCGLCHQLWDEHNEGMHSLASDEAIIELRRSLKWAWRGLVLVGISFILHTLLI